MIVLVAVAGLLVFVLLQKDFSVSNKNKLSAIIAIEKMSAVEQVSDMPILNLPIRYFAKDSIEGSSNGSVVVDEGYRSFPTTTITLQQSDFINEKDSLPPLKTAEEIFTEIKESSGGEIPYKDIIQREIKEYGDLALRFFPDEMIDVEKFDVDMDGKSEIIVSAGSLGENHFPDRIIIIKNNKIIFAVSPGMPNLRIERSETGNGFYIRWVPSEGKWGRGLCCPLGYMRTRFVYENGKFKPVYEQEVLYFVANNTE